jgi:hypothetical protein
MPKFYAPCMAIHLPDNDIEYKGCSLIRRRWQVDIFDMATLASKNHRMRMKYELAKVLLDGCNLEIAVEAEDIQEARQKLQRLKVMLYIHHVSPFIMPFATSYSVNEYAGINGREGNRKSPYDELNSGPKAPDDCIDLWPFEQTLGVISREQRHIHEDTFTGAVDDMDIWSKIIESTPSLKTVQDTLVMAPFILDVPQSILHIWTAIESLFPKVTTEVTFRVSLNLAQLSQSGPARSAYLNEVKKAYSVRSNIAHGTNRKLKEKDWDTAWNILLDACRAILQRQRLPTEDQLLAELLDG